MKSVERDQWVRAGKKRGEYSLINLAASTGKLAGVAQDGTLPITLDVLTRYSVGSHVHVSFTVNFSFFRMSRILGHRFFRPNSRKVTLFLERRQDCRARGKRV